MAFEGFALHFRPRKQLPPPVLTPRDMHLGDSEGRSESGSPLGARGA